MKRYGNRKRIWEKKNGRAPPSLNVDKYSGNRNRIRKISAEKISGQTTGMIWIRKMDSKEAYGEKCSAFNNAHAPDAVQLVILIPILL